MIMVVSMPVALALAVVVVPARGGRSDMIGTPPNDAVWSGICGGGEPQRCRTYEGQKPKAKNTGHVLPPLFRTKHLLPPEKRSALRPLAH